MCLDIAILLNQLLGFFVLEFIPTNSLLVFQAKVHKISQETTC